ncbi:MAG: hypothetical protein ABIG69_05675 [Bacteroidota bacterium]
MKKIVSISVFIILFSFSTICLAGIMQPKTGNSATEPAVIVVSNNFYQCRYNIVPYKKIVDGETVSGYSYDYIELKEVSEASIEEALTKNGQSCDHKTVIELILAELQ